MSYREGEGKLQQTKERGTVYTGEEKEREERREVHQPGRGAAGKRQGLLRGPDHASGSLSLVFPPNLKALSLSPISITWACPTKVTSFAKEKSLVPPDHLPSIALGSSASQLGQTQVPMMRRWLLRGKLPLHLTLSLVCVPGAIVVRDAVPVTP